MQFNKIHMGITILFTGQNYVKTQLEEKMYHLKDHYQQLMTVLIHLGCWV